MPASEPNTPTVAVTAASVTNCEGGNQAAAMASVPVKVTVAPRPTTKRPAKRSGSVAATAIAMVPAPITAPPAATTRPSAPEGIDHEPGPGS